MRAIHLLLFLTANSICLSGAFKPSGDNGRPRGEEQQDPKPAPVRDTDLDVISAVLSDMSLGHWEYPSPFRRKSTRKVVISMQSRQISELEITRHFGDKSQRLTHEIREDIVRRNRGGPRSLELLKPPDDVFMVGERGWVRFWSPGYSSDGETAVVILLVEGFHSQYCAVGLSRHNGRCTVEWRRCTYYI